MSDCPSLTRITLSRQQEFVEAQRNVRSGPTTSFSREPLREIAGMVTAHNPDAAGYVTFALEMRHLESVGVAVVL